MFKLKRFVNFEGRRVSLEPIYYMLNYTHRPNTKCATTPLILWYCYLLIYDKIMIILYILNHFLFSIVLYD